MDFASLAGMIAGFTMVFLSIVLGGSSEDYVNLQGVMVVVGGTLSATLLNFRFHDVKMALHSIARVFTSEQERPLDTLVEVMKINTIVRKQGKLALDEYLQMADTKKNRIMKKAVQLSLDNISHNDMVTALRTEIDNVKVRDTINQEVFKKMAVYAPSMGMIGTLIGLVQMLSQMSNPAELGPAMGLALLTTFYGAFLSTLVFIPIAGKLRVVMLESIANLEIIYEGATSLATDGSPVVLYERAISYIMAGQRASFDELKERIDADLEG